MPNLLIFARMDKQQNQQPENRSHSQRQPAAKPATPPEPAPHRRPREIGGPKGPEPTRYGDWEVGGRCTDF
jgi:hypothetical protein